VSHKLLLLAQCSAVHFAWKSLLCNFYNEYQVYICDFVWEGDARSLFACSMGGGESGEPKMHSRDII
jgi:hypothetical protein